VYLYVVLAKMYDCSLSTIIHMYTIYIYTHIHTYIHTYIHQPQQPPKRQHTLEPREHNQCNIHFKEEGTGLMPDYFCIYMYVCVCVYAYVCVCVYVCMYVYAHYPHTYE
jgi:hypothetical protein